THMHKNEDFTVTVLPRENYSETNTVLVSGEEVYVDSDSGAVLNKRGGKVVGTYNPVDMTAALDLEGQQSFVSAKDGGVNGKLQNIVPVARKKADGVVGTALITRKDDAKGVTISVPDLATVSFSKAEAAKAEEYIPTLSQYDYVKSNPATLAGFGGNKAVSVISDAEVYLREPSAKPNLPKDLLFTVAAASNYKGAQEGITALMNDAMPSAGAEAIQFFPSLRRAFWALSLNPVDIHSRRIDNLSTSQKHTLFYWNQYWSGDEQDKVDAHSAMQYHSRDIGEMLQEAGTSLKILSVSDQAGAIGEAAALSAAGAGILGVNPTLTISNVLKTSTGSLLASTAAAEVERRYHHSVEQKLGAGTAVTGILLTPGRGVLRTIGQYVAPSLKQQVDNINAREMNLAKQYLQSSKGGDYWGPIALGALAGARSYTQMYSGSYLFQVAANPVGTANDIVQGFASIFSGGATGGRGADRWDVATVVGSFAGGYLGAKGLPGVLRKGGANSPSAVPNLLENIKSSGFASSWPRLSAYTSTAINNAPKVYAGLTTANVVLSGLTGRGWSAPINNAARDPDAAWRSAVGFSFAEAGFARLASPITARVRESGSGLKSTALISTVPGAMALGTDYALTKIRGEDYSIKRGAAVFGGATLTAFGLGRVKAALGTGSIGTALSKASYITYPFVTGTASLVGGVAGGLVDQGKNYNFSAKDSLAHFAIPAFVTVIAERSSNLAKAKEMTGMDAGGMLGFTRNLLNRIDPTRKYSIEWNNAYTSFSRLGPRLTSTTPFYRATSIGGMIKAINPSGLVIPGLAGVGLAVNNSRLSSDWKNTINLGLIVLGGIHATWGLRGPSSGSGLVAFANRMKTPEGRWNFKSVEAISNYGALASGTGIYLLNRCNADGTYKHFNNLLGNGESTLRSALTLGSVGLLAASIGGYKELATNLKKPIWTDNLLKRDGWFSLKGDIFKEGVSTPVGRAGAGYTLAYYGLNRGAYWGTTVGWIFGAPSAYEKITGNKFEDSKFQKWHTGISLGLVGAGILGPGVKPTLEQWGRDFNLLTNRRLSNGTTMGGGLGKQIFTYEIAKSALPMVPAISSGMAFMPDIQNYVFAQKGQWAGLLKLAFGYDDFQKSALQVLGKTGETYDLMASRLEKENGREFNFLEAQRLMGIAGIEQALKAPGLSQAQIDAYNDRRDRLANFSEKDSNWLTGEFRWGLRSQYGFEGLKVALWFGPSLHFIRPLLETGLKRIPVSGELQSFVGERYGKKGMGDALFPEVKIPGTGLLSRGLNAALRPAYMVQSLTIEEQVRENIFSAMFNPMVARSGYKFSGDFSSKRFALEQQALETVQEANDASGFNVSNINRNVLEGLVRGNYSLLGIEYGGGSTPSGAHPTAQ
ncbi:MAG: hypothetical protein WC394_03695, partial [Candidatus Omnitrophota bacterium]